MRKQFVTLTLLSLFLLLLAACVAATEPAADAGADAVADGAVEMEFWYSGTAEQLAFVEAAIDEYNEMQDDVTITLVESPPSRERIATALTSGQGPDILWYNHNMPWFFGVEAVYPLNEFVMDPEIGIDGEQLLPAARESVQYAGIVQALPINHCPGGLIYNRAIFEEAGLSDEDAPQTWEEVEALAIQLTEREGDDVTRWGLVTPSVDWMLQELLLGNGGDWVSDDLAQYITDPDSLVEGLEWWHSLREEHGVMPVPSGVDVVWRRGAAGRQRSLYPRRCGHVGLCRALRRGGYSRSESRPGPGGRAHAARPQRRRPAHGEPGL